MSCRRAARTWWTASRSKSKRGERPCASLRRHPTRLARAPSRQDARRVRQVDARQLRRHDQACPPRHLEEDWKSILDTNLTGTLRGCQVFGRAMLAQGVARSSTSRRSRRSSPSSKWHRTRRARRGRFADAIFGHRMGQERRARQRDRSGRVHRSEPGAARRHQRGKELHANADESIRQGRGAREPRSGVGCASQNGEVIGRWRISREWCESVTREPNHRRPTLLISGSIVHRLHRPRSHQRAPHSRHRRRSSPIRKASFRQPVAGARRSTGSSSSTACTTRPRASPTGRETRRSSDPTDRGRRTCPSAPTSSKVRCTAQRTGACKRRRATHDSAQSTAARVRRRQPPASSNSISSKPAELAAHHVRGSFFTRRPLAPRYLKLQTDVVDVLVGQYYNLFGWQPTSSRTLRFSSTQHDLRRTPQIRLE